MEHNYRGIYKSFTKVLSIGFILVSVQLFCANFSPKIEAAINNTINFQSKIVDKTTGLNVSAGTPACVKAGADTCDFQVRIWNDSTGTSTTAGSGNLMFTQTFQDVEIGNTNGTFNLVINSCGSVTSGNSQWGTSTGTCTVVDDSDSDSDAGVNFDRQDLYIEVGFAPTDTSGSLGSFTELFSRTSLRSVPSAFVAQTLSGIGANGFVQVAPSATQTITSTNSLVNLTSTATGATNPLILVNENGTGTPDLIQLQVAGTPLFKVDNTGALTAVGANISGLSASSAVYTDSSKNLTSTAPTSGTIGYLSRSGTTLTQATANDFLSLTYSATGTTTSNLKLLNSASSGTYNTTAGVLSNYAGYFANTSTRATGANALTNIGLYATASGAQNNYAAIFESGNVGIGTTTPAAQLNTTGNVRFNNPSDATGGSYLQVNGIANDGRMQLSFTSDSNTTNFLKARGGYGNGCYTLGMLNVSTLSCGGVAGNIVFSDTNLALSGYSVGGLINTGTHKSLLIGTPNSIPTTNYGATDIVDIGTYSSASNTWGGTRPSIRFTGYDLQFRVDSGTGQSNPGTEALRIDSTGKLGIGGITNPSAYLQIAASTTSQASLRLTSSAGTDPSSPNSGDLWWNGTSLNFRTASSTVDLLASVGGGSYVNFIPGSTQTTTSTNSLINLTSTATGATNPLIIVNENGSGTPDLLQLKVGGSTLFKVDNSGVSTANGGFRAPSGSVSVLPYAFSDDLSTGIYGDGAGKINFASLGTTILSLNGTTSAGFNIGRVDFQPANATTPSINFGDINTGIYKAATNELGFSNSSSETLRLTSAGDGKFSNNLMIGTSTNTAYLTVAAATTAKSSLRLVSSAGTNPSAPNSGDLWWNGTSLNFRTASSTIDLLNPTISGYVQFASGSNQNSTNTNGLINISTSGNVSSTLFTLNENGAGTPNLFELQNAGATRFLVNNNGAVALTPAAGTATPFSVSASFSSTGGANQAMSLTASQTVATTGSVDSFLLTPIANVASGSVGGMNGLLARVTTSGGVTVVGARGFSTWGNIGSGTTVNDLYNFDVLNPVNNGTINNNFGLRIDTLTAGTNDYGIYIAGADTYAIWSDAGTNRFDGITGFGGAPNANDQVTITGTVNASSGLASGLRLNNNLTATANSQVLTQLLVSPTYTGGAFTGLTKSALFVQTNASDAAALVVETVSSQSQVIDIRDSIGFTMASINGIGRISGEGFTGTSSSNTKLIATGSTAGSGSNGSIYFLDSAGTTRGRFDTAKTVSNTFDGDGADGSITITGSTNINTTPIATGRVTYADGIAYRVNAPGVGDTSVTRFRSADTISNGLTAGDDVLLINLQGNTPVLTNNASVDAASVGNHEILTIASVSASTITFTTPVQGRYVGVNASNQRVIVQRVPNYTTVTINSGGTLTASAYEGLTNVPTGGTGYLTGIVAFKATGTVTVNTGGTITTSSLGYRGGAAGASGANGGFNGESYGIVGTNTAGRGGSGASNGETWGGGRSSNGAATNTGNGTYRGGGGGGGSNGSASTGDDGSGAGGGGGYGGGGGGGGGGSNLAASNGGAGGTGGATDVAAGGGAGAQNTATTGVAGGNAGSAGTSATGVGGAAGNGQLSGSGGAGAALTTASGAGGGGGGLYGDPLLRNLFYGSGGGGGAGGFSTNTAGAAGGQGGGIIHILANSISLPGTGTITSNGAAGTNGTAPASGGGGGAGGSISLQANTLSLGTSLVVANGGAAGSVAARRGASGGGGVGRIYYEYVTSQSGTTDPAATVAQITNNYGTLYVGDINTAEADLAEFYITGDRTIEAGDVVSISPYRVANNNDEEIASQGVLRKTDRAYDSKLIGVISTAPGITLGSKDAATGAADNRALALKGRVPVKIDPDSEPISIGDYLTSSVKPGYAKKATEPGYVLGKALEYWNKNLNKTSISVFIDLGYYYGGNTTTQEALNLASQAGLSISGYSLPSKIVNIISRATDGQVLGTSTSTTSTEVVSSTTENPSLELEQEIKLALGSSELSDYYQTTDGSITTGDVIKFDDNQALVKAGGSEFRGDKDIVGVVSTQPNIFLNGQIDSVENRTITMGGKVVLKVTDINGPIKKGDYLAASDIPGYAMKADNANGVVLGRALEDFPLSLNPDSSMVRKELAKNKTQALNMIADLVRSGKFTVEDNNKYTELVNNYYSEFTINSVEGKNAGRIMAVVNIGYIAEGMVLPKNTNVADGSIPGSNGTMHSGIDDLINAIKNTDLTLNNILTVKNVIEAQTYQNITGLDLAFKITSANNSFRVLDLNDESLIAVDQNGKITLKEGKDSSVGEVIFPPQTNELFIENKSVTEKSRIYLTPSEFVFSKVRAINPGYGFTIELQNVMDQEIKVNYLIIN